jgi:serine/threonine protein kinase
MAQLTARDPVGLGLPSVWALRLIRRLLSWDPSDRPTAEEALGHAFFRDGEGDGNDGGDGAAANGVDDDDDDDDGSDVLGRGYLCQSDAREFEFVRECTKHCASVCKM